MNTQTLHETADYDSRVAGFDWAIAERPAVRMVKSVPSGVVRRITSASVRSRARFSVILFTC